MTSLTYQRLAAALAVPTIVLSALTAAPAVASGGDDVRQSSGSCSESTDWKIKAKADDGRIEVEAEVDSNTTGQDWAWKLKDNGVVVAKGTSTTQGASGSFSVERKPANRAGTDHFVFRAVYAGEVCRATVAW
jgi:hypothetical protein